MSDIKLPTEKPGTPERIVNLFVLGAMKSGTTSLHEYLDAHPDICMSRPKELHYFLGTRPPEIRFVSVYASLNEYLARFPGIDRSRYLGESSTSYAKFPRYSGVAERIYRYNPEARLIYVMRDPAERAISHYWHDVRLGRQWRPIGKAFRSEPHYTDVSDYPLQLREYLRWFRYDQLFTLTFERMICEPRETIGDLIRWLGLNSDFQSGKLDGHYYKNPIREHMQRSAGVVILGRLFAKLMMTPLVAQATPPALLEFSKRSLATADEEMAARKHLREQFAPKIEELTKLLGRRFPEWTYSC